MVHGPGFYKALRRRWEFFLNAYSFETNVETQVMIVFRHSYHRTRMHRYRRSFTRFCSSLTSHPSRRPDYKHPEKPGLLAVSSAPWRLRQHQRENITSESLISDPPLKESTVKDVDTIFPSSQPHS